MSPLIWSVVTFWWMCVYCSQIERWPRRRTRAPCPCSAPLAVGSMGTPGPTACVRCVIRSTSPDRTVEVWVLSVTWVSTLFFTKPSLSPPPFFSPLGSCTFISLSWWAMYWYNFCGFHCFSGSSSVTNSPTSEASAIQIIEASLNNSVNEADSPAGAAAALPVTQQMTEMSISCEEEVAAPNVEIPEPG